MLTTVNVRPPLGAPFPQSTKPLKFFSQAIDPATGYGRLAIAISDALNVIPVGPDSKPDIILSHPGFPMDSKVRFTMWEPDELPPQMLGFMGTDALIVPCMFNVGVFRRAGFRGQIHRVQLWGDAPFIDLPSEETFKFICIARDNSVRSRKGIDDLIEYFKLAFPKERDVRLTVKSSPHCFRRNPEDDRIKIIYEDLSKQDYERLLGEHHCGVFLSGLEGWNFPACELMATGRPSLIVPWGGPTEFVTNETSWLLPFEFVPAPPGHPYHSTGRGGKPLKDGVIAAFREAYTDRDLWRKKARASYINSTKFTKENFAERLRVVARDIFGRV